MNEDLSAQAQELWNLAMTQGADLLVALVTAIAAWIVGRWLIKLATRMVSRLLQRGNRIDATLARYLESAISALLNIILILAILDIFGVKTTSFAALLAGAGLAVGAAWSGLLSNFAAGAFLQVLRPYKVGDFVKIAGVEGTVRELGILSTTLLTPGGVMVYVGNNKALGDNIMNYSVTPLRSVSCSVKIANSVDPMEAMERLRPVIAAIPNVAQDPAPVIEIVDFTPEGPKICVNPSTNNKHYWQVFVDTNRAIVKTFAEAGYPVPETPIAYNPAVAGES